MVVRKWNMWRMKKANALICSTLAFLLILEKVDALLSVSDVFNHLFEGFLAFYGTIFHLSPVIVNGIH